MKSFLILFALIAITLALSPDCPSYSQVTTCTPKCKDDAECASAGGKCCPNLCNAKSCVNKGNFNKNTQDKCKISMKFSGIIIFAINFFFFVTDSSSGGAGSYCGNVKCNAFEKCALDKSTKRQQCVRS